MVVAENKFNEMATQDTRQIGNGNYNAAPEAKIENSNNVPMNISKPRCVPKPFNKNDYKDLYLSNKKSFKLSDLVKFPKLILDKNNSNILSILAAINDKRGFVYSGKPDDIIKRKNDSIKYLVLLDKDGKIMAKSLSTLPDFPKDDGFNLIEELNKLAKAYKRSLPAIHEEFQQVNGNIKELENKLKGEKVVEWNPLEDYALNHPEDKKMYEHLIKMKGEEQIEKRRNYLNSFKGY